MRIEFVGISGVGKTYIAKKIIQELINTNDDVVWPSSYDPLSKKSYLFNNIKKSVPVVAYAFSHCLWVCKLFKLLIKLIHHKFWQTTIMMYNGIYLKYLINKYSDCTCLFDEGLIQYIWGVYLRNKGVPNQSNIDGFIDLFGIPDKLYVITAKPEIIAKRIRDRGRYVYIGTSDNIISTINIMQSIQNSIIKYVSIRCGKSLEIVTINND